MSYRNRIGATTITVALLLAPFTPAVAHPVLIRPVQQGSDVPSDAEQAMFTKGQNLYLQKRYDQAITVLTDFLKTYPNSIITDLTLLWLGRAYMQLGRLQDAEQVGKRLRAIKDTPFGDIYESELETARSASPARSNGNLTTAATPEKTPSPVPTPPTPSRTPTASVAQSPRPTPSPNSLVASNKNMGTATSAGAGNSSSSRPGATPVPTPRLITATPGATPRLSSAPPSATPAKTTAQIEPARPENARRRNREERRIRRAALQRQQAIASANQNSATSRRPARGGATNNTAGAGTPAVLASSSSTTGGAPAGQPNSGSEPPSDISPSQGGGLNITVKQVPNLILSLRRASEIATPGQTVQLPLTITNTGNKEDQFSVQTDLPAEYQPTFSLVQGGTDTGLPILVTPRLARNASVDVLLNLHIPETASDGQQRRFFVRAASQSDYQVIKVADGAINIVAATLGATTEVSQNSVMPGDTFMQSIAVRNSGSAPARSARADFVFNPEFELVSASPSPLVYDRPSRTAIWSLGDLGAHDSREIKVTLRAVPEALASTSSLGRGTLRTQSLPVGSNFDSPSVTIGKVPRARIDAVSAGLTATPGDTIYVPFVVRNPGNTPDSYDLSITAPGAPPATIYADTNGDGQHQESEPPVTQTAQIAPQGGQFPLLLRVQIPSSTPDRQQYSYNVVARSMTSGRVASEASTVLTVAAPRVRVRPEQVTDVNAPGDTIFYRLVLVNEGSGLARNLVVTETLPEALEFLNSEPSLNAQEAPGTTQRLTWRVPELAPGDTAVLRIAVRLRPNLPADVSLTTRHTLTYQDSNGNSYQR